MKSITILLALITNISFKTYSQQIIFQKNFPPPPTSFCHRANYGMFGMDMAFTPDSTIMILGECVIAGDSCGTVTADNAVMRLLKLTANGDTILSRVYMQGPNNPNHSTDLVGYSISRTFDNKFIIAGNIEPGQSSIIDAFLIKVDSAANLIWQKEYHQNYLNYFSDVIETGDHGYLAGGITSGSSGTAQIIYVVKTDSEGNEQWHHTYNDGFFGFCSSLINNHDGTYSIIGGIIPNPTTTNFYHFLTINIDSTNGNEISRYFYGDTTKNQDCARGISTSDNKYVLIGNETGYRGYALLAIKADYTGNIEWYKNYGGDSTHMYFGADIKETCDSGFMIVGSVNLLDTITNSFGTPNYFLFKIDKYGNKQWEIINSIFSSRLFRIKEYFDHGYIAVGASNGCYVIRFDSLFICNPTSIFENNSNLLENNVLVYPNPFTFSTTIEIHSPNEIPDLEFILYDTMGTERKRSQFHTSKILIEKGNLASGIYFYKIGNNDGFLRTGKLIIKN